MRPLRILIGLLLLPLLAGAAWTLLDLSGLLWHERAWGSAWFWALAGGFAIWLGVWIALPRPLWLYVLGHELTHALAVYLHAGTVYRFKVSHRGGHVISDKSNWFIALAPYFVPLYCLLWMALWWSVDFYCPLSRFAWVLYAGIGIGWGFHLTFTASMIRNGQSDLEGEGVFFSLVLILILNLLLIELGLVAVTGGPFFPHLGRFAAALGHRTGTCYWVAGQGIWAGLVWLWKLLARLFH